MFFTTKKRTIKFVFSQPKTDTPPTRRILLLDIVKYVNSPTKKLIKYPKMYRYNVVLVYFKAMKKIIYISMSIFNLAFPVYIFIPDYIKINVKSIQNLKINKQTSVLFLTHLTFIPIQNLK